MAILGDQFGAGADEPQVWGPEGGGGGGGEAAPPYGPDSPLSDWPAGELRQAERKRRKAAEAAAAGDAPPEVAPEPTGPAYAGPVPGPSAEPQAGPEAGRELGEAEVAGLEGGAETFAKIGGQERGQRGMLGAILSKMGLFGKPGANRLQASGGAVVPGMAGRGMLQGMGGGGWQGTSPSANLGGGKGLFDDEEGPSGIRDLIAAQF